MGEFDAFDKPVEKDDFSAFDQPVDQAPAAEKPGVLDRIGSGLTAIGRTVKAGAGAVATAAEHPLDTIKDPSKRREFERGLDNMITLGYGQRFADWAGRKLGDAPEVQIAATGDTDRAAAPGFRELGSIAGAFSPGAAGTAGKVVGKGAQFATKALKATNLPAAAILGAGRAGLSAAASGGLVGALHADSEGRRLDAGFDAATDPASLALSGALGAVGGAGERVLTNAKSRVDDRILRNIGRGEEGGKARLSTTKKLTTNADSLEDTLGRNKDLERALASEAASNPGKAAARVQAKLDELGDKTKPFYDGIDEATGSARRTAVSEHAADLSAKADAAEKKLADLKASATPAERSLLDEARKIDAPVTEPTLADLARQVDAPVSGKAAREAGRSDFAERVAAEQAAAATARAAATEAVRDAAKEARLARSVAQAAGKVSAPDGIDISAIDKRMADLQRRMGAEGKAQAALAVGRSRAQLASLYGADGSIPPGTVLPARSVRNLATEIGQTAFSNDPTVPVPVKNRVLQDIHGAVAGEIEAAAERAGLDAGALRQHNRDMANLITVKSALADRASKGATGGTSIGDVSLTTALTSGVTAGAVTGHIKTALAAAAAGYVAGKARPIARGIDYNLAQRFGRGAPQFSAPAGARLAAALEAARAADEP